MLGKANSPVQPTKATIVSATAEPYLRPVELVKPLPESDALPQARRELDDEEAAAFAGLRDFLHSLAADRKMARERNGRITVRLSYAV